MSSPQVEYRRLGKSGLRVSVPILGAMSFGNDQWAGSWVLNEDQVRSAGIAKSMSLTVACRPSRF
jgi:aryl-alcohol dehydrogenase-like predicted oxidoreductase